MKNLKQIYIILFFIFSCNSNTKENIGEGIPDSPTSVIFQKLDSIQIEYLGNPTVHDIEPLTEKVLFMDHKEFSEHIHIADFDGRILSSFSKFGDLPDSYDRLMGTVKIINHSSFLVYGYRGFLTYDFEGNLLSLVKYSDFHVPSQTMMAMGYGMEKLGSRYLFINQNSPPQDLQTLKEFKLLSQIDPDSGSTKPIIKFPEQSLFLNGNYFFMKSWFPVFTLDHNFIYVAFGIEPIIYAYDVTPPYKLACSIPIKLPEYRYYEGSSNQNDKRIFGMSLISGRIENIKKLDSFFIVGYFPGFDNLDTESNFENKKGEESAIFRNKMKEKYPARIAILDSLGNIINDFIPENLEPRSMLLRNGELWMQELPDEEVERDYFRLFRVGLKIED